MLRTSDWPCGFTTTVSWNERNVEASLEISSCLVEIVELGIVPDEIIYSIVTTLG